MGVKRGEGGGERDMADYIVDSVQNFVSAKCLG